MKRPNHHTIEVPKDIDKRVFARIQSDFDKETKNFRKPVRSYFKRSFISSMTATLAIVLILTYTFSPFQGVRYAKAAEDYIIKDLESLQQGKKIRHQTIIFKEGRDKHIVTKKLFPDFSAGETPARHDVLHQWSLENANKGIVISNMDVIPAQSYLFHEKLYHYNYPECPQELDSQTCAGQHAVLVQEKKSREYLDQVHDLSSLYTEVLSHELDHKDIQTWIETMKFDKNLNKKSKDSIQFKVVHGDDLFSVVSFDKEEGRLTSREIYLRLEGDVYHMSSVEYGDIVWFDIDEQSDIFNTSEYNYNVVS